MSPKYFLESVDRAMKVLDCFTPETPELRLTDISNRLGATKSQILRVTSTLESGGYLVRDPDTKRFRLGVRLFHLGMIVYQQMDLRAITRSYLQRLVEETHETARLVVPTDDGPICIELVESPRSIRVYAQIGARMPWNAGTSPKVILAYLNEDDRERILAHTDFKRFTASTTTDSQALRAEVLAIRNQGFHIGVRDLDADATGISAPVFDGEGQIVGAINVSGPSSRLCGSEAERIVHLVSGAASDISMQLGHRPGTSISFQFEKNISMPL